MYHPSGGSSEFLDDFAQLLEILQSLPPDPVIFGDFNLDPVKHISQYIKYASQLSRFNLT